LEAPVLMVSKNHTVTGANAKGQLVSELPFQILM
jgi:hypothetical protein